MKRLRVRSLACFLANVSTNADPRNPEKEDSKMRKTRFFLTIAAMILILFLPFISIIQTAAAGDEPTSNYTIAGWFHGLGGEPLTTDVAVSIKGTGVDTTATVDGKGYFAFTDLVIGKYEIEFTIPAVGKVFMAVYDHDGEEVSVFIDSYFSAGNHSAIWEGNPVAVGNQEEGDDIPRTFVLFQNYPNPFNPATEINFLLPNTSYVTLEVFNSLGQKIATLVDEKREAGRYQARWDGTGFPSGVYFYRLETQGFTKTIKMLLMK